MTTDHEVGGSSPPGRASLTSSDGAECSRSCCLCINTVHKPEAKVASHVELKKENRYLYSEKPRGLTMKS